MYFLKTMIQPLPVLGFWILAALVVITLNIVTAWSERKLKTR